MKSTVRIQVRLPKYNEIPNVGLFLEQTTKYIGEYMDELPGVTLTSSMISNYVKKGIITNPVKKQYNRDQIAYLLFIAVAKTVLSLEDIQHLIRMQMQTYDVEKAYTYFCSELERVMAYVCGERETLAEIEPDATAEKHLLRKVIIAVAHKVYLDKFMDEIKEK